MIKKIKEILNDPIYPDDVKKQLMFEEIAKDKDAIPAILSILSSERRKKKELISEMNLQLSRAHIALEKGKPAKRGLNSDRFVEKEIEKFYILNHDQIGHCFKDMTEEIQQHKEKRELSKTSKYSSSEY